MRYAPSRTGVPAPTAPGVLEWAAGSPGIAVIDENIAVNRDGQERSRTCT